MTTAFQPIEKTIRALIEARLPGAAGKVGGDLSYARGGGFYVWIGLVPGAGSADRTSGTWAADLDIFADNYLEAMQLALDLEAILLDTRGFRESGQQIDVILQNTAPRDVPWDDDSVFRISATYTFTARRAG